MKYIGKNKQICQQIMDDWESRNIVGGEKMLLKYMEKTGLSEDIIFYHYQIDWEYSDCANASYFHTIISP